MELTKDELRSLARLGALNAFCGHRRAALWQVERDPSPDDLFSHADHAAPAVSPLRAMDAVERVQADYRTQRLATGPHPMKLLRAHLPGVWRAAEVGTAQDGAEITIGSAVICRQRSGTARGDVFISLEDETGAVNAVVSPGLFEAQRLTTTQESFCRLPGRSRPRVDCPWCARRGSNVWIVRRWTVFILTIFTELKDVSQPHDGVCLPWRQRRVHPGSLRSSVDLTGFYRRLFPSQNARTCHADPWYDLRNGTDPWTT